MTHIQKYTAVQQCSQTLPQATTGRSGKDVIQNAEEIYQELKLKEVGLGRYANLDDKENEFVEVYEDVLNELSEYCGSGEIQNKNTDFSKIQKMESAIRGAKKILQKLTDTQKIQKMESAIRGAEKILQKLKG